MQIKYGFKGVERSVADIAAVAGPGWSKIVRDLCRDLFDLGWNGTLLQIKEKWGELRFYIGEGSDAVFRRIDEASALSRRTCIVCGGDGKIGCYGGWYSPYCDEHAPKVGSVEMDY